MHIAAASTLFFAALAAADSHGHARRFHHRRSLNETMTTAPAVTSEAAPLTTLTVQTTVMSTIYNCGKNITETTCDGNHATDAVTVTQVIDLTTIVCPEADASSVQSSVLASATLPAPVDAKPTPYPTESAENNSPQATDQVLTYTLGPEGSQTVVTTTIKNTKTATDYTTKFITYDGSDVTATVVAEVTPEPTTTIKSTTTSTRFVTVPAGPEPTEGAGTDTNVKVPAEEAEGNSPSGSEGEDNKTPAEGENNNTPAEGANEDCPAPVTVTVAATTVYVTVTPEATPAPTAAPVIPEAEENNGANGGEVVAPDGYTVGPDGLMTPCPSGASTAAPAATSAPAAPAPVEDDVEEDIPHSTIYVIPTPVYSNNTMPASTQGAPAPSGFLTKSRPSGTGSVIEPAPTGGLFY